MGSERMRCREFGLSLERRDMVVVVRALGAKVLLFGISESISANS